MHYGICVAGLLATFPRNIPRWAPERLIILPVHYCDVIMSAMASEITSLTIVYSTVYSGADQSKHRSSALLAFMQGIHRSPVNSPHKWPVTRKCFHLMTSSWITYLPYSYQIPPWFPISHGPSAEHSAIWWINCSVCLGTVNALTRTSYQDDDICLGYLISNLELL